MPSIESSFMATRKHDESWGRGVPALNMVGDAWVKKRYASKNREKKNIEVYITSNTAIIQSSCNAIRYREIEHGAYAFFLRSPKVKKRMNYACHILAAHEIRTISRFGIRGDSKVRKHVSAVYPVFLLCPKYRCTRTSEPNTAHKRTALFRHEFDTRPEYQLKLPPTPRQKKATN